MTLKDKLFVVVNDTPTLNGVGLNIKEFKDLYMADKSTDKSQYAKELAVIYHLCEYSSPYYDMKNKEQVVFETYMGKSDYKMPARVKKCLEVYKSFDTPEKRALDASVSLCESISDSLISYQTDAKQMDSILKEIDDTIAKADDIVLKIELIKTKNDIKNSFLNNAKAATDLIPKIEKHFDSLSKMRIKVVKADYAKEDSGNSISNFIMDDLMRELEYEHNKNQE